MKRLTYDHLTAMAKAVTLDGKERIFLNLPENIQMEKTNGLLKFIVLDKGKRG